MFPFQVIFSQIWDKNKTRCRQKLNFIFTTNYTTVGCGFLGCGNNGAIPADGHET